MARRTELIQGEGGYYKFSALKDWACNRWYVLAKLDSWPAMAADAVGLRSLPREKGWYASASTIAIRATPSQTRPFSRLRNLSRGEGPSSHVISTTELTPLSSA